MADPRDCPLADALLGVAYQEDPVIVALLEPERPLQSLLRASRREIPIMVVSVAGKSRTIRDALVAASPVRVRTGGGNESTNRVQAGSLGGSAGISAGLARMEIERTSPTTSSEEQNSVLETHLGGVEEALRSLVEGKIVFIDLTRCPKESLNEAIDEWMELRTSLVNPRLVAVLRLGDQPTHGLAVNSPIRIIDCCERADRTGACSCSQKVRSVDDEQFVQGFVGTIMGNAVMNWLVKAPALFDLVHQSLVEASERRSPRPYVVVVMQADELLKPDLAALGVQEIAHDHWRIPRGTVGILIRNSGVLGGFGGSLVSD